MYQKEKIYQQAGQSFIEQQWQRYNSFAQPIYCEEFSTQYADVLQPTNTLVQTSQAQPQAKNLSPMILGDHVTLNSSITASCSVVSSYSELKQKYKIFGLREKIKEFNQAAFQNFINKHKDTLALHKLDSVDALVNLAAIQFSEKFLNAKDESLMYKLIFYTNKELPSTLKRIIDFSAYGLQSTIKDVLQYNVIYYEKAGNYTGKNSFYLIRERRIPTGSGDKTERPDFVVYINGIPLIIIEYKTEDSGILEALRDFEAKYSYTKAPFKIALNDGIDVFLFSSIQSIKLKEKASKTSIFKWVHYHPVKKYEGQREYLNIEYLFDELICQPKNLYYYCMDACSTVSANVSANASASGGVTGYLINGRIQQYYALKDTRNTFEAALKKSIELPYNYEYAHAQRSGKTITMKHILYMLDRDFLDLFDTVFMYVPDLQIKKVLKDELTKSGNDFVSIKVIETRRQLLEAIKQLSLRYKNAAVKYTPQAHLTVYLVNMQKLNDDDFSAVDLVVSSKHILNMIDEAHHGQSKNTAVLRDKIFPNASNFLFTATGKPEMYAYYFPDNNAKGFRSKFTISDSKKCDITVPVLFTKLDKLVKVYPKLDSFITNINKVLKERYNTQSFVYDPDLESDESSLMGYLAAMSPKIAQQLKAMLWVDLLECKQDAIIDFMNESSKDLTFNPKAIVYVNDKETARSFIKKIQARNGKGQNQYKGYTWGVDFSDLQAECSKLNPGIINACDVEACFEKTRTKQVVDNSTQKTEVIIDILVVVDKYQKGFDLPTLVATFLDTTIAEPSKINQIYTRTATKYPGKSVGYCVDLTLDNKNETCFKHSLDLYDNAADTQDCFLDTHFFATLKQALTGLFADLQKALALTKQTFTSAMILQQVLNEKDLNIRKTRQYKFFRTTKAIFKNLSKLGSPFMFKPFKDELYALITAFEHFKKIYADKSHVEYSKILINMDTTCDTQEYITLKEIKEIINEVLSFMKESNLQNIISLEYDGSARVVDYQPDGQDSVYGKDLAAKLKKEANINKLSDKFERMKGYLAQTQSDLYNLIRDMLERIMDDRSLVYDQETAHAIENFENQLQALEQAMDMDIYQNFSGDCFKFWVYQMCTSLFKSKNIENNELQMYIATCLSQTFATVKSRIDVEYSIVEKVTQAQELIKEITGFDCFSGYVPGFLALHGRFDAQYVSNIRLIPPDEEGLLFFNSKLVFNQVLSDSLKQYYYFVC